MNPLTKGLSPVHKNILILSSSPRLEGNSRVLCQALSSGAAAVGHETKILDVAHMRIHPCTGCQYCYQHSNQCIIHDDMDLIWKQIDWADVIVFASPIYFFNVSAQLKLVIDRLYSRYSTMHPNESVLLLSSADSASVIQPVCLAYQKMAACCHLKDRGVVCASHVWEPGDIQEHPALRQAYDLGCTL